ncbi:MAG: Universal stress protein family, partial [uncultured Solirubrobacteraceae bacterium]
EVDRRRYGWVAERGGGGAPGDRGRQGQWRAPCRSTRSDRHQAFLARERVEQARAPRALQPDDRPRGL